MTDEMAEPIYFTKGFRRDIDWVFGGMSLDARELCAIAFAIADSAVFYKCVAIPDRLMERTRDSVSFSWAHPEMMEIVDKERQSKGGKTWAEIVHIHPDHSPRLSPCDIATYERARGKLCESVGSEVSYPVLLVTQKVSEHPVLHGFRVDGTGARNVEVRCVDDGSEVVVNAWKSARKMI